MTLLEIAVFNYQSAWQAAQAGAHRLELCENAGEGGTTPSYGTMKLVKEKINIPVFPIIRPRGGDFLYSDAEFSIMLKDVLLAKELGFEGVVTGVLHADGTVDVQRTSLLAEKAYPLEVTFHRAFDRTADAQQALEDVITCGCTRILTSGQVPNAADGAALIKSFIEQADDRIIIMPGSGVRSSNLQSILSATGATEIHSSARRQQQSSMQFQRASMNENMTSVAVDEEEIRKMLSALS